ncbi:MAG: AAA family ATPase [Syntrophales bacterium]|nr:AAA family ATPase [Syntrophales bacterium]
MDYLSFYRLKEDPFGITPDPDFFYPSKWHTEAIQSMEYLIQKGEGFMLLTGDPGTGKTTLIRTFLKKYDGSELSTVVIYHSILSPQELLKLMAREIMKNKELSRDFNVENINDKVELINCIYEACTKNREKGSKNLVIIDEAQDLPEDTLTLIKHLSNIESEKEKFFNFILLAQPYFEKILSKPSYSQLNQRISIKVNLFHLDREEVGNYIKFRIQRAGDVPINFDRRAIKEIYKASKGIPRLINLICSRALMVGYVKGSYEIKKSFVKAAVEHLKLKLK